jgi:penicillin-binding protein-related factor A (putative recombinase)
MANEAGFSAQLRNDLSNLYNSKIFVQLIPNMIRTGKKPFDFWFLYNHHFCAVECKWVKKGEHRFAFKEIRSHQPECLKRVIDSGGGGCFCVGFNDYKASFFFTPDVLDILQEYSASDISITYEELYQYSQDHPDRVGTIERKKIDGFTRWEVEKLICCE